MGTWTLEVGRTEEKERRGGEHAKEGHLGLTLTRNGYSSSLFHPVSSFLVVESGYGIKYATSRISLCVGNSPEEPRASTYRRRGENREGVNAWIHTSLGRTQYTHSYAQWQLVDLVAGGNDMLYVAMYPTLRIPTMYSRPLFNFDRRAANQDCKTSGSALGVFLLSVPASLF